MAVRQFDRIRHPAKRAFLAAFRQTGNVRASTEAAGVDRTTYYVWCENDLVFAAAAKIAKEDFADLLETKLSQIAMQQDNLTAIIVALKMTGRFVEKTKSEISGPEGQPLQILEVGERDRRLAALAELARTRAVS